MEISQNESRISNLPEDLILNILLFLPLEDAARTSVLSRFWRHNWHNIPYLEFDNSPVGRNQSVDVMIRSVGQIVSAHRRPIVKFTLHLFGPHICPEAEINPILNQVLQRGVREFDLHPSGYENLQTLPMELFLYTHFTTLNLHSCRFEPPPTFIGFRRLTSLLLFDVSITSGVLTSLICNGPLLVELDVRCNDLVGSVVIVAPKLKRVTLEAPLTSLHLVNAPLLERVELRIGFEMDDRVVEVQKFPDLIGFHSPWLAIEYLQLDYLYLQGLAAHGFQADFFIRLETLRLTGISFVVNEVLSTFALIGHCPNLRKVTIKVYNAGVTYNERDIRRIYEDYGHPSFKFGTMKEIEIEPLTASFPEMLFIKCVLAKSPYLETMTLTPWTQYGATRLQMLLGRFFQMSPNLNIILRDPIGYYNYDDDNFII